MSHPDEVRAVTDDALDRLTADIVEIWRVVLRDPDVRADTDLFDVGGTSLVAVRIRSNIRAFLGKEIELVDIMEHPTPRELAEVVRSAPEWEEQQPWHRLDWSEQAPDGGATGGTGAAAGSPFAGPGGAVT